MGALELTAQDSSGSLEGGNGSGGEGAAVAPPGQGWGGIRKRLWEKLGRARAPGLSLHVLGDDSRLVSLWMGMHWGCLPHPLWGSQLPAPPVLSRNGLMWRGE